MKPIDEVYDKNEEYGWGDYQPMLDSMGYEILCQQEIGSWQGDTLALMRDGLRYGFLVFGWGSCSGCDSLQACSTLHEVHELRQQIHDQIVWKDNASEMLSFLQNRDWESQWYWDCEEQTVEFVDKCIAVVSEAAK